MMTIALSGKKGAGRVALIDDADLPLVENRRWHLSESSSGPGRGMRGPYATTAIRQPDGRWVTRQMHTLITGWPLVDHQDHDGLNNQRYNLRPATYTQNQANRRRGVKGSSKYKGVCWRPDIRKWRAQIGIGGTKRYLGAFANEKEAALAYNAAALEAFGSYAYLNQVDGTADAA